MEFKTGDRVVCIDNGYSELCLGGVYIIDKGSTDLLCWIKESGYQWNTKRFRLVNGLERAKRRINTDMI